MLLVMASMIIVLGCVITEMVLGVVITEMVVMVIMLVVLLVGLVMMMEAMVTETSKLCLSLQVSSESRRLGCCSSSA